MHLHTIAYTQPLSSSQFNSHKAELTSNLCFLPEAVFTLHLSQWIIGRRAPPPPPQGCIYTSGGPLEQTWHIQPLLKRFASSEAAAVVHSLLMQRLKSIPPDFKMAISATMTMKLGAWR